MAGLGWRKPSFGGEGRPTGLRGLADGLGIGVGYVTLGMGAPKESAGFGGRNRATVTLSSAPFPPMSAPSRSQRARANWPRLGKTSRSASPYSIAATVSRASRARA